MVVRILVEKYPSGSSVRLRLSVFALAVLAVMLAFTTVSTKSATASAKNANLDGTWKVVAGGSTGFLVISGENVNTGSFGGEIEGGSSRSPLKIVAGRVSGNQFSLTCEIAGTVVGEHGAQFDYGGTVNGNDMSIKETGLRVWHNGHPVDATYKNPGPWPGTRESKGPAVSSVTPAAGLIAGGTNIAISGSGFLKADGVHFRMSDGKLISVASFSVASDSLINAVLPNIENQADFKLNLFPSDVIVSVGTKDSPISTHDAFTFERLTVTGLSIHTGLPDGGTDVKVKGSGFIGVTKVEFRPARLVSLDSALEGVIVRVESPTELLVQVPKGKNLISPGLTSYLTNVVVSVGSLDSAVTKADQYSYEFLLLTKVSPSSGPFTGGNEILLSGSDFPQVSNVYFLYDPNKAGVNARYTLVSPNRIRVLVPDMSGFAPPGIHSLKVDIIVTALGTSTKAHPTDQYILANLEVRSLSPSTGPAGGTTRVTLSGSGLTGATAVTLSNGTQSFKVTPVVSSDTSLTFTTPSLAKLKSVTALGFHVTVSVGSVTSSTGKSPLFTYLKK